MGKRRATTTASPADSGAKRNAVLPDRPTVLGVALLIAAAVWSYWPSLGGKWLMDWDDNFMVVNNRNLVDLAGLWRIWVASPGADYWPMSSTLLWLEWHLFGLQPLGYHLCNLALHVCSGALIWRVLAQLGLRWGWLGGLLFIVHPLTVESIAWVSEIKNALSLPLFLWALSRYIQFDASDEKSAYGQSLLLYVAAMLSKTSVVMLPLVLLLYCWWKRREITRQDLMRMAPFFALALILGTVTICMQTPTPISQLPAPRTPFEVLLTAGQSVFFYIGNFLVPVDLALIYPRWTMASPTPLQLVLWPLLIGLLALAFLQKRWGRHVLLGLGFFLLNLAPLFGFVHFTYMKLSWGADHFTYLPIVGLVGLTVAGFEWLHAVIPANYRRVVLVVIGIVIVGLSLETRDYARAYSDETALWTKTIERNPQASAAYDNLGLLALNSRNYAVAIQNFQSALQIQPNSLEAHCNLATALVDVGDTAGAIQQLQAAQRINPHYPVTWYDLGTLYLRLGQLPEAITQLKTAVDLSPHNVNAKANLGYALTQSGQAAEAVPLLRSALQDNPNSVNVHFNLGTAFLQLKDYVAAASEFQATLVLSPGMTQAQQLLQNAQELEASAPK